MQDGSSGHLLSEPQVTCLTQPRRMTRQETLNRLAHLAFQPLLCAGGFAGCGYSDRDGDAFIRPPALCVKALNTFHSNPLASAAC